MQRPASSRRGVCALEVSRSCFSVGLPSPPACASRTVASCRAVQVNLLQPRHELSSDCPHPPAVPWQLDIASVMTGTLSGSTVSGPKAPRSKTESSRKAAARARGGVPVHWKPSGSRRDRRSPRLEQAFTQGRYAGKPWARSRRAGRCGRSASSHQLMERPDDSMAVLRLSLPALGLPAEGHVPSRHVAAICSQSALCCSVWPSPRVELGDPRAQGGAEKRNAHGEVAGARCLRLHGARRRFR